MRILSVDETPYNLLRRVVTILSVFYSIFAYIAIMRGGINLLGYLLDLFSFSITQISFGTLIGMQTK